MKSKKIKQAQKTPKGHEIPIPKRGDVMNLFKKAAKPQEKESSTRSPKKKGLK
jgi:hypothetical protein